MTRSIKKETIVNDDDGSQIIYYPNWLPFKDSLAYFEQLKTTLPLERKDIIIFGRKMAQPRFTSWHADTNNLSYSYSGLTVHPQPWTPELKEIKEKLNNFLGVNFNSVLANYYPDGDSYIGRHSDDERGLGPTPDNRVIASVSLGGLRQFVLQHRKTNKVHKLELQCGSLVVMQGTTQQHWTHEITKTKKAVQDRLNLTYRVII